MAKKDEVLEEVQKEVPVETPKGAKEKVEAKPLKVKEQPKKPKQFVGDEESTIAKVDLTKVKDEQVTKEDNVTKVDLSKEEVKEEEKVIEEVKEEEKPKEEVKEEETPVLEEITDEEEEKPIEEEKPF